MSAMDPRTPVIVGAAALSNRSNDTSAEPIEFLTQAAEAALGDAGEALRSQVQWMRVVRGIWPYKDPGRQVAARLGLPSTVRTGLTAMGGNEAYDLVGRTAAEIAAGDLDVVVLGSAETMRTRRRDRAAGRSSAYLDEPEDACADESTDYGAGMMFMPSEAAVDIHRPINFYAMAEVAMRHANGESPQQHLARVSSLWASATTVAAGNPEAWYQQERSAEEVGSPSAANRPIAHPYPKLMTANVNVDQTAAVVMCSAEAAAAAGVPRDQWVFPHAWTGARDAAYITNRASFTASPAMTAAGPLALELAGIGIDDCAHLDLYSCFPAAVQLAQKTFGADTTRPWTITGGLTFAGGPLNGYCMQALARAVQLSRAEPAGPILLTGNGGFFTKHSFLVLSGQPSDQPFQSARPQGQVSEDAHRAAASAVPALAEVEAWTVTYDRDGAAAGAIVSCLDAQGHRLWALGDADVAREMLDDDPCGSTVSLAEATTDDPAAVVGAVQGFEVA